MAEHLGRRQLLTGGGLVAGGLVAGAVVAGRAGAAAARPHRPADPRSAGVVPVGPSEGMDRILAAAAGVRPRPAQLAWQRREVTAFTHFGMNTFTDREWGSGLEIETRFCPSTVDVEQWMTTYRAAGARQAMLTAKHHDGFVLYPTRHSPHSIMRSGWRHDLLGRYVRAARAAGLKVGVYLSPADGAELPHAWFEQHYVPAIRAKKPEERRINEIATLADLPGVPRGRGRYGNGSAVVRRTIPTPVDGHRPPGPTFTVNADDYNAYYLNQLYEIFTGYGPIDELWLDGANPWADSGIVQPYDFTTWFDLIHRLSPQTVTFAGPQGVRWVGNEDGAARETEWSVVPQSVDPSTTHGEEILIGGATAADLGSRLALADPTVRYLQWFPAEADVSIRPGWFWHPAERPKTAAQLVELYHRSVGRNAVLLLNVPPDRDGRIAAADRDSLAGFAATIERTYRTSLLTGNARSAADCDFTAVTDPESPAGWSPPGGAVAGTLVLELARPITFDRLRLGEDIAHGQSVEQFVVDRWDGTAWRRLAAGTTIGHSRILSLAQPVTTDRLRLVVLDARTTPRVLFVGAYRSA